MRNLLGKVDALWMLPDETVVTSESLTFLLLTAFKHNLPVLTMSDAFVEAGAWWRSLPIIRMRVVRRVRLAREIENGRLPAAGPVLSHHKGQHGINLQTAASSGWFSPGSCPVC